MLLNCSTTSWDSATDIEKTSQKGAPEQERPNRSRIKTNAFAFEFYAIAFEFNASAPEMTNSAFEINNSHFATVWQILRERFNVRTFLGLTATTTSSTIRSIREHLDVVDDAEAVLQESILPKNLILSASADEDKDAALLKLLTRQPFSEYGSIIVYCLRRNECERLAAFLRTSLQVC